ncbi:MAG: mannose-1-phosphate guanylyltransferase/mannose-6-phosphate isomerase [Amphiplicatus sp.]
MSDRAPIQPVIMSGGAGTRLWPMSREARPKQFIALASDETLFQETARRVRPGEGFLAPLVIAGAKHAAHIAEQLGALGIAPAGIVIEPCPRNTAAVAAVAAEWVRANSPGSLARLLPADHHVADGEGFRRAVADAASVAADRIVTFGIKPDEPHTGFGYIECGDAIKGDVRAIAAFREKPDLETAKTYLAGGRHFWNAGVFLFNPHVMLSELALHAPQIRERALASLAAAARDGAVTLLDRAAFETCPADSVDYAVMEKTKKAAVAGPLDIGWNDIGSWSAISGGGDSGDIIAVDAKNCLIRTEGPLVGAVGVDDLVIVATGDAVLVARKDRAQDVKKIVEALRARGRTDLL